ncbi:MAG: acetate--CoA ligase family protein, partial [Bdellovibrionales bacterium]|nr:acetate--CoA ligase family protein [Bdellovibrionales bacterium]
SLLETEAREILEIHGLPVCEATLADSLEDLFECCQRYDFPLAMKIVSPDILHKSDIGGVKLNLRNEGEAFAAYKEILEAAKRETSADRIVGVLVAPMVASGPECIVGMLRDPFFGPVLMFGMGGVLVEAMKDISFRVFPLFERDIVELIQAPLGYKLLKGYRGKPPSDTAALEKIVEQVALLAHMHLDIMEIDLNPTVALADGASILDARIIIR